MKSGFPAANGRIGLGETVPSFATLRRTLATMALWLCALATPDFARAQTAQDHGANRIEPFRQFGVTLDIGGGANGRSNRTRACTADHAWCAEIVRGAPEARLTLVIAPGEGLSGLSRTYLYALPATLLDGGGVTLWDRIVIEADGAVMVGLDLSKETRRAGLRSYQRRLLLLRAGPGPNDFATPVLEAPLSGHVEMAACPSPQRLPSRSTACTNRFESSSLFTLAPLLSPGRPALIMTVRSFTMPGARRRSDAPRGPIERTGGDEALDSACTYTRSFHFSEAQGRYLPDGPLPVCPDFFEP
jgi:hypothetical protein